MDRRGFSLLEVILSLTIAVTIVTVFIGSISRSDETIGTAGFQVRGQMLADECLFVARWIRDARGLDALAAGAYGLSSATGQWELTSGSDTDGTFTRQMTISDAGDNLKDVSCSITWEEPFGNRDIAAMTRLAKW